MREKHLAVGVFGTKISDDDQKICSRKLYLERKDAESQRKLKHKNTLYLNTENTEQTEFSFLSCFSCSIKKINAILMWY